MQNVKLGKDGPMRIGFMLNDAKSEDLLRICKVQGDEPYRVIEKCIEIMIKYLDEDERDR